jgi:uncharacterized membrane protein
MEKIGVDFMALFLCLIGAVLSQPPYNVWLMESIRIDIQIRRWMIISIVLLLVTGLCRC